MKKASPEATSGATTTFFAHGVAPLFAVPLKANIDNGPNFKGAGRIR